MKRWQAALLLTVFSWGVIRLGLLLGHLFVPPGEGLTEEMRLRPDLFRFDSAYYYSIATDGYAYNGEPYTSPNIVFAPLFPLAVRVFSVVGIDPILVGFLINKILIFFGFFLLFDFLSKIYPQRTALGLLLAVGSAAGAYSLHAYYSEATLFFLIALILWAHQRQNTKLLAIASGLAGCARLAALPISAVTAGYILLQNRKHPLKAAWAIVSFVGAVIYLGFIAYKFGNPFVLFPEIQTSSWAFFHPKVSPFFLLGPNLLRFTWAALGRGIESLWDIQTLNLVWTLLALTSFIYSLKRFGLTFLTILFGAYFLFIYFTGSGSEFLISAHRFYLLMLPIFLMFADLYKWLANKYSRKIALSSTGLLFLINLLYGLLHTAFFNQGIWFYF